MAYVPLQQSGGGGGGGVTSFTGDSVAYNNSASTGAVTLSLIAQIANKFFAGPTSGGNAAPTWRAMVIADLPTAIPNANLANSSITINGDGVLLSSPGATALGATAAFSLSTQLANKVFAGPTSGGALAPTFRTLVALDIPNIAESQVTNLTTDLAAKQATLTGTGLARNTGACTELSGDVTTSGSNATTLANIPTSVLKLTRNAQVGTTYTVLDTDRGKVVTLSNASPIAVTLPQAGASSTFIDGWYCYLKNIGAGTAVVTPTTSTIDSANKMVMPSGSSCLIYSDGTNYFLAPYGTSSMGALSGYFNTQGDAGAMQVVGSGTAMVAGANEVYSWLIQVATPKLLRKVTAKTSTGVAAATFAAGLYDFGGNKLFSTGSQGAGSNNLVIAVSLSSIWLLLPGTYMTAWTTTSTSVIFYPSSLWNIGSSALSGFFSLNTPKYAKAANAASSGDTPATLGALSNSALAMTTAVPFILFE